MGDRDEANSTMVRVLGPVDGVVDGVVVDIGARQQRRLLAALATEPGRVVGEDALIDSLWADGDLPGSPRTTLQQYVSNVRGALGADVIERVDNGYRLGAATTDVSAFEALVARARTALGRGDETGAHRDIAEAVAMWRGAAFGDLRDEEAVRAESARLDGLYVAAKELAVEVDLARGALDDAAASAEALCAEFPLSERPVRALAEARHRAGQRAEALRVLAEFRERLVDETGIDVSEELRGLERELLADDGRPELAMARHVAGYQLGELIGEGAFGAIYRATQPSVGRDVAVKVVRAELANDPEFVRRFEVEAQTVARLEHPHIVPLYDFWRDPSGAYLVMRYLSGGSAAGRLVQTGPWALGDIARMVDEIGAALAVAHDAGVVHRDVKPENILFDETGNSYLADFGIAVDAGAHEELDLRSAGSPLYVSPEQARDGESTTRSDVYAFGIVLFELLCGRAPFGDSGSVRALLQRKMNERVPSVSAERPDIPTAVDLVVQTATDPDPARRFESMSELVLAFRAACGDLLEGATTTGDVAADDLRPRQAAGQTLVSLELEGVNPYKGLAAFGEADVGDFFGRDALVEELTVAVGESRLVVVTGPSGSGKSSAVRAGLVSRLRAGGSLVASIIPGVHPFDEVETALLRLATEPPGSLLEQLHADERGLARAVKRVLPDDGSELVLVVDQLEELFTLTAPDVRDRFLEALAAAVGDERSRMRVVATLRADFYDRPLQHPAVSELVRAHTVAVTPLTGAELEAAVTQPAARTGVSVEPALVAELIAEVRGHPAGLPLLQFVLTELYERRDGGRMTLDAYREIGGVSGALANRADDLFGGLDESGQSAVRRLFTRLITPGEGTEDTRRRVLRSELAGVSGEVIDAYGDARLLTFDHDPSTREPTVEVAHEALIREWPRVRRWLDDDRHGLRVHRQLGTAAEQWAGAGCDEAELYRGGRLEAAEEWAGDHLDDLNDVEASFLEASQTLREAQRDAEARSRRRFRGLFVAVAVVAVVALIAGAVAFQQRGQADDARADAEAQALLAGRRAVEADEARAEAVTQAELAAANEARAVSSEASATDAAFQAETGRLQAEAARLATVDVRLAARVAAAAYRRDPSPASLSALQRVLVNTDGLLAVYGGGEEFTGAEFLGDDLIVAATRQGVRVYDVGTGEVVHELAYEISDLNRYTGLFPNKRAVMHVRPDGLAVLGLAAGGVVVVDLLEGREIATLPGDLITREATLSDSGTLVAWVDDEGWARVARVATGELVAQVRAHPDLLIGDVELGDGVEIDPVLAQFSNALHFLHVDDEGSELVLADGYSVSSWDLDTGEQLTRGFGTWNYGNADSLGPLVIRSGRVQDRTAELLTNYATISYDLDDGEVEQRTIADFNSSIGFRLGAQGATARSVGLSAEGEVLVVDVTASTVAARILHNSTAIHDLGISADGTEVLLATDDGITRHSATGAGPLWTSVPAGPLAGSAGLGPDGDRLMVGPAFRGRTEATVWDLTTKPPTSAVAPLGKVSNAWFTYDGRAVEVFGLDNSTQLFDPDTFESLGPPIPTGGYLGSFLSPDKRLRSVAHNDTDDLVIYETATGDEVARARGLGDGTDQGIEGHSFDPDWERVVGTDRTGKTMVWSTDGWEQLGPLDLDLGDAVARETRFSTSGDFLFVADSVGRLHVLAGDDLTVAGPPLTGFSAPVQESGMPHVSGDQQYVMAIGDRGLIWERESGELVGDAIPSDPTFFPSLWNHDGTLRAVTAVDDRIRIWTIEPDTWPRLACLVAGRTMTTDEWDQVGPRDEDPTDTCADIRP